SREGDGRKPQAASRKPLLIEGFFSNIAASAEISTICPIFRTRRGRVRRASRSLPEGAVQQPGEPHASLLELRIDDGHVFASLKDLERARLGLHLAIDQGAGEAEAFI